MDTSLAVALPHRVRAAVLRPRARQDDRVSRRGSAGQVAILSLFGVAGLFEFIGGAFLVIGLFTRPVAILLSGEMAVGYFLIHAPQGFFPSLNGGELAILYCFAFLFIGIAGAGVWSIDAARTPAVRG